jgi:hypothetical protein
VPYLKKKIAPAAPRVAAYVTASAHTAAVSQPLNSKMCAS